QYGLLVPNFDEYGDPRTIVSLAREAQAAGWDGFFIWDHVSTARSPLTPGLDVTPLVDPWIALSAVAAQTERIRLGPMVTPLPRRRPWKLAWETVCLDHLSGGRVILGVGSGVSRHRRGGVRRLRGGDGRADSRRATRRGAGGADRTLVGSTVQLSRH